MSDRGVKKRLAALIASKAGCSESSVHEYISAAKRKLSDHASVVTVLKSRGVKAKSGFKGESGRGERAKGRITELVASKVGCSEPSVSDFIGGSKRKLAEHSEVIVGFKNRGGRFREAI